jgi:glycosyltransferase involved in cell wall biosynthesis
VGIACHRPSRGGGEGPEAAHVLGLRIPDPFRRGPWAWIERRRLDRKNAVALRQWARSRSIDLVHAHLINADTRYARPLADALGVAMVVTLRGGETEHWLKAHPGRAAYVRRILADADFVTALSPSLLDMAVDLEPTVAARSAVIPNPCDPEAIRSDVSPEPLRGEPERPFVVFVGRLAAMKDVGTLIDAIHRSHADEPDHALDLVIVGDGELRRPLERQARGGPAALRIHFLGATDRTLALGLMRRARGLVLPSVSSEGCPNVVMEALALGTPVLTSDLPAASHMIDAGAAGAVFPRRDPARLAALLRELHAGRLPVDQWREAGRRLLAERHDPNRIFGSYESLYSRMMAGQGE